MSATIGKVHGITSRNYLNIHPARSRPCNAATTIVSLRIGARITIAGQHDKNGCNLISGAASISVVYPLPDISMGGMLPVSLQKMPAAICMLSVGHGRTAFESGTVRFCRSGVFSSGRKKRRSVSRSKFCPSIRNFRGNRRPVVRGI